MLRGIWLQDLAPTLQYSIRQSNSSKPDRPAPGPIIARQRLAGLSNTWKSLVGAWGLYPTTTQRQASAVFRARRRKSAATAGATGCFGEAWRIAKKIRLCAAVASA